MDKEVTEVCSMQLTLQPNDTIWCHHGHGRPVHKPMGTNMGSLVLGDIL